MVSVSDNGNLYNRIFTSRNTPLAPARIILALALALVRCCIRPGLTISRDAFSLSFAQRNFDGLQNPLSHRICLRSPLLNLPRKSFSQARIRRLTRPIVRCLRSRQGRSPLTYQLRTVSTTMATISPRVASLVVMGGRRRRVATVTREARLRSTRTSPSRTHQGMHPVSCQKSGICTLGIPLLLPPSSLHRSSEFPLHTNRISVCISQSRYRILVPHPPSNQGKQSVYRTRVLQHRQVRSLEPSPVSSKASARRWSTTRCTPVLRLFPLQMGGRRALIAI